jgi:hypothetical protein
LSLAEVAAASQAEVLAAKDVEGESGRSGDVLKMGRPGPWEKFAKKSMISSKCHKMADFDG